MWSKDSSGVNINSEIDKNYESNKKSSSNVIVNSVTMSSVTISLHPLVVMNLSEHWTRIRCQSGIKKQVFGILIGKQKGRNIEVMNSFELKVDIVGKDIVINQDYYKEKEKQYKQVFCNLDLLGWYTTGDYPTENEIHIHKQICEKNECSIMMLLNPVSETVNQLPIQMYETVIDIVHGSTTMLFVPLTYTLATEEAERIGVDHVARMLTNEYNKNSAVAEHLFAQYNAIKMLNRRVKTILEYVKMIEEGKLPRNQKILRDSYSLSCRLPVIQSNGFIGDFYAQTNDVALITYLAALTKGSNHSNNFVNKFLILYDRRGIGRRMRGLFF